MSPSNMNPPSAQLIVPAPRAVWQVALLVEVLVEFPVVEARTSDEAHQYAVDLMTAPQLGLAVTLGGVPLEASLLPQA